MRSYEDDSMQVLRKPHSMQDIMQVLREPLSILIKYKKNVKIIFSEDDYKLVEM